MHAVAGIKLGTSCAGIKQAERDDLLLIEMAEGASCAAVFTQNASGNSKHMPLYFNTL
jgi:glutamate N-acetyltransferase/amino-acid N-acetyltransferase